MPKMPAHTTMPVTIMIVKKNIINTFPHKLAKVYLLIHIQMRNAMGYIAALLYALNQGINSLFQSQCCYAI